MTAHGLRYLQLAYIFGPPLIGGSLREKKMQIRDIDFTPKEAPLPKGCKKYQFHGFETIASSENAARRKYEKWAKQFNNEK